MGPTPIKTHSGIIMQKLTCGQDIHRYTQIFESFRQILYLKAFFFCEKQETGGVLAGFPVPIHKRFPGYLFGTPNKAV